MVPSFWNDFLAASFLSLPEQPPQGLSNIVWALSAVGVTPSEIWLETLWEVRVRQADGGCINRI